MSAMDKEKQCGFDTRKSNLRRRYYIDFFTP